MSQHHSDPVENNVETHPLKLAIAVTLGAVGLVVGIIMVANFSVGSHRVGETETKANTPDAIAQRIAPVIRLEVEASKGPAPTVTPSVAPAVAPKAAAGPAVAMVTPAPVPASAAAVSTGGEGVFKASCSACHATGVAGAPKVGDKSAWAARIAKGKPMLYDHALKGFNNVMPPKGGNPALSDGDVKSAVDYLVAQGK